MTFHHFHVHSGYSQDGIGYPSEYIKRAIDLGMKGIAFTEHGSMKGIVDAYNSARMIDPEFKIIAGVEIYIYIDNERFHLTLLGDGVAGYNNLCRIINDANKRQLELASNKKELEYNRALIDDLLTYSENVYVLTGCPASIFQKESLSSAISLVNKLTDPSKTLNFSGRIFSEGMLSSDEDEGNKNHIKRAIELSNHCKIPLVITNDIHRPMESQIHAHRRYLQMNFPMYKKDPVTNKLIDKSVLYKDLYLMGRKELMDLCYHSDGTLKYDSAELEKIKQGMDFTNELMSKINPIKFNGKASLPHIVDADSKLRDTVYEELEKYIDTNPNLAIEAKERVDYELDIIISRDFSTYFLLVKEFVEVGNKFGVVGKGRGSAAGSLVAFLMGITDIDPLEYDLIFERFLNPKRKSYPDIDIDMSMTARNAVIEYAHEKYNAMPIITNSVYSDASLINDLAKYHKGIITKEQQNAIKDYGKHCKEYNEVCKNIPEFDLIWDSLLGQIRHIGSHAGGIVIIPEDSETLVPTVISKDGTLLAGYTEGLSGHNLEVAGGVKFDILGLSTLTALEIMENLTNEEPPRIKHDEYNDCFELLNNDSEDISGIFQLSGVAAQQVLSRMPVKNIDDIIVVTSIARTGARESGTQEEYINNVQKIGYPFVEKNPKEDSKVLVEIELGNGNKVVYPDCDLIKLSDGSFKMIKDLDGDEDIYIL